ncbi:MAG: GNAT family N-acetyltransferase [Bacillota bacterium]
MIGRKCGSRFKLNEPGVGKNLSAAEPFMYNIVVIIMRGEAVQLKYLENPSIEPEAVAYLRKAVGWDQRLGQLRKVIGAAYLTVGCFYGDNLVGFVDVVSDGVDDALIRNLLVHPDYQGRGIALNLLKVVIERLKDNRIKTINVLFEPKLFELYRKAGFRIICGGIIDNEAEEF